MPQYNTRPELAFAAVPEPFDPMKSMGRALSIKGMMQQQRMGAMQEQQMGMEMEDQKKMREAFTEAQGDWDKTFELAAQKGVSPGLLSKLDSARLERRQKLAAATKEEREAWIKQAEIAGTSGIAFKELRAKNPQQAEQAYAEFRPQLEKLLGRQLPEQLPDDGILDFIIMSSSKALAELRAQQGEKRAAAGTPGVDRPFSAEVEAQKGRITAAGRERQQVPGVDVPFPPDVEKQKGRISAAGRSPQMVVIQTVDGAGNPITKIVPKVVGSEFAAAPTADMQNAEFRKKKILPAIQSIQQLGNKVITEKSAIVQRAKAAGRKLDTVLGDDPDFKAYQAARYSLAGNLAVAQQGSRPSDADIFKVWLPLVPDEFSDTTNSAALKWKLVYEMSGFPAQAQPGAGQGSGTQPIYAVNPQTKQRIVSNDGGKTWQVAP